MKIERDKFESELNLKTEQLELIRTDLVDADAKVHRYNSFIYQLLLVRLMEDESVFDIMIFIVILGHILPL